MKKIAGLIMMLSAGIILINSIEASAHGKDSRGGTEDAQMKKLHAMMPVFSVASAELESALDTGDAVAATIQAERILAAVPDLKKSKPHKNIKQRKKFVAIAADFEKTVVSTVDFIKKGDLPGAKAAFKKVEEACAACHARFRD